MDEGLSWSAHIGRVCNKTAQLLGVVGRAQNVLEKSTMLSLYNGLVLPHLQYCLMVWGDFKEGRNMSLGNQLLRYQIRFTREWAGLPSELRGATSLTSFKRRSKKRFLEQYKTFHYEDISCRACRSENS